MVFDPKKIFSKEASDFWKTADKKWDKKTQREWKRKTERHSY